MTATRTNLKKVAWVVRRKKSIAPAVIEKILCDKPRRFCGL